MTAKWQPGHTYVPGSLVVPNAATAPAKFVATNGYFEDGDTGWDYSGGVQFASSGGYGSPHCCVFPGPATDTHDGEALNKAKFYGPPGTPIRAGCMIQQGASDVDHTRGYVVIHFYGENDVEVGTPVTGNIVNDGRGGAWHPSTVDATFPADTVYARAGIHLYQNSSDAIWGDNLVVDSLAPSVPNGLVYKATQTSPGKSGTSEPAWPGTTGVSVTDNEVTWEGVIASSITWTASPIMESGDTEPTWPTDMGATVRDGTVNWTATSRRITDTNCPNSKVVAIMAAKIFAADGDIVRFSATANPLDWTSEQDAGYLPTGLQQANANDMAVLAPYRSNLTAFNASSFQNWQVDPDPSAMAILDQMEGIGSTHQKAAQPVGDELFYLSQLGVRTVSVSAASDNLKAGDVGMPVDVLVQAANNGQQPALATYYPGSGQYWLAFRDYVPLALSGDLPDATVGTSVDYRYAVSGGTPPYSVSISTGALPDGLTMDASGHVTGTPTTVASFTWDVQVTDALGKTASLSDGNSITQAPPYVARLDNSDGNVRFLDKDYGLTSIPAVHGNGSLIGAGQYVIGGTTVGSDSTGSTMTYDESSEAFTRVSGPSIDISEYGASHDGLVCVSGTGPTIMTRASVEDDFQTQISLDLFFGCAAVSDDGSLIAVCGYSAPTNEKLLRLYTVSNGVATLAATVANVTSNDWASRCSFSADNHYLVIDCRSNSFIFDVSVPANPSLAVNNAPFSGKSISSGSQPGTTFSSDGSHLFSGSDDGINIYSFDGTSATPDSTLSTPLPISTLYWSADRSHVLCNQSDHSSWLFRETGGTLASARELSDSSDYGFNFYILQSGA